MQLSGRIRGSSRILLSLALAGAAASANFEYAARLTEIVLLGEVALRAGKTLHWDGPDMTATNAPEAEPFIRGYFRKGWEI